MPGANSGDFMAVSFPFPLIHPIENLLLDEDNPRLPADLDRRESSIVDYLIKNSAIEDLIQSISENGFFFAEAIVAVPKTATNASNVDKDTPLVVVEGNRRLTALKILQSPELAARRPALRKMAEEALHKPDLIPTIVYEDRDAVLRFLGYRHITGVKPWEPLAKARYIEQLFDRLPATRSFADRYREVAQMVGSKSQYVRRSLNALFAFNVAVSEDYFGLDLDEGAIDFSLLLTALGYKHIQSYLAGADKDETLVGQYLIENPDLLIRERLAQILDWLFVKQKDGKTRVVDSRNISRLAAVIENDKARSQFIEGKSLEQAYIVTEGTGREFNEYMQLASGNLNEAASLVAFVEYSPTLFDISDDVVKQARHINRTLLEKKDD